MLPDLRSLIRTPSVADVLRQLEQARLHADVVFADGRPGAVAPPAATGRRATCRAAGLCAAAGVRGAPCARPSATRRRRPARAGARTRTGTTDPPSTEPRSLRPRVCAAGRARGPVLGRALHAALRRPLPAYERVRREGRGTSCCSSRRRAGARGGRAWPRATSTRGRRRASNAPLSPP